MVSPVPGVAEIVSAPVPHRAEPDPAGANGRGFTVARTAALVGARQPARSVLA